MNSAKYDPCQSIRVDFKTIEGGVTAPKGFKAAAISCGIKNPDVTRLDLMLITSDVPTVTDAVFTTNKVRAACVRVCQQHIKESDTRAIIANSGNANACTGPQGIQDAKAMCKATAEALGVRMRQVMVCSTGIIGMNMPIQRITPRVGELAEKLSDTGNEDAARAIMTSDTKPKIYAIEVPLGKGHSFRVGGIAKGCELSGCALIGGETAEMPGMYPAGEYDLAGFAVGAVEKSKILTGQNVAPGDVVLGLASHGVHSNGFSLVRKCIERAEAAGTVPATLDGKPFKQAIMEPTRLYVKNVLAALAAHPIKALAHITGGGLLENIPRVLPEGTAAHLKKGSWPQTELFAWLQKTAGIDDIEMNRTFNNGIGMVVVVDAANAEATAATLRAAGEQVYTIGAIAQRGEGAAVVVA